MSEQAERYTHSRQRIPRINPGFTEAEYLDHKLLLDLSGLTSASFVRRASKKALHVLQSEGLEALEGWME